MPGAASTSPVSTVEVALLLTAVAIAIALRIPPMTRGFIADEITTAMHFVEVDSLWTTISTDVAFNNHIAYSILARFSQATFGRHEWSLRLPALLLGVACLPALWVFGRRLLGPRVAIAATFFLALSPYHIALSVTGRGYAGMILFTLISSHLYFKLLDRPTHRDGLKFVLCGVAAIYFHLYAAAVVVVQVLLLLCLAARQVLGRGSGRFMWLESFRILWLSFGATVGLSLLCYAPVSSQLSGDIAQQGVARFQPLFPLGVLESLSGSTWAPVGIWALFAVGVGLISLRRSHPRQVAYWILLFLVPVSTAWLVRQIPLADRFFIYLLPHYLLLVVSGLWAVWRLAANRSRGPTRYALYALCAILAASVLCTWCVDPWRKVRHRSYREVMQAMQAQATESTAFCGVGGGVGKLEYYSDRQMFFPRSMEQFQQIAEQYSEIKCAYHGTPWTLATREGKKDQGLDVQAEIILFLSQNAEWEEFSDFTVFTYRQ